MNCDFAVTDLLTPRVFASKCCCVSTNQPSPTILGLNGQDGMNGVVHFFPTGTKQWQECLSPIAGAARALTSYHSHISLFISAPPASFPLASRSVSLCYLKPEILPLPEPLCCICLPRCLCVWVRAHARVCVCVVVCVRVNVYESALKKTQAASGRARERGGESDTGGKGKKHPRRQKERECETAMKFIQAICLLLLCPALSLNTR